MSKDPASLKTTLTAGPNNGAIVHSAVVEVSAKAEGSSSFECKVDSPQWFACSANHTFKDLAPGDHTVAVRAITADGKPDPRPVYRHFRTVAESGQVKPNGVNTGVPRGTSLRTHHGDLVITKAGTVIDAMDIHGTVKIEAPNVTIRRSIIRGGDASNITGLVMNYERWAGNTQVEDSLLVAKKPSAYMEGLKGMNIHGKRLEITGVVDGAGFHGDNNSLHDSWIHDLTYYGSGHYPGAQVPTHNDGIQIHGGNNGTFKGNRISGADNAAVMVTQDVGSTSNQVFEGNWFDEGSCSVNIHDKNRGPMNQVVVKNNQFGKNTTLKDCAIIATKASGVKASGNTWVGTDETVPVKNGG